MKRNCFEIPSCYMHFGIIFTSMADTKVALCFAAKYSHRINNKPMRYFHNHRPMCFFHLVAHSGFLT